MALYKKIRYVNIVKIINLIRLQRYYNRKKNEGLFLDHPSFISVEPTNYCNLKCPACPSGSGKLSRPRGYMDINLFRKIIDEQKKYLINLILHFQGEPLLNRQLGDFIKYARQNNIYTMFSTNGQLLTEHLDILKDSKPDKVIISLDGLTQETYNKYRVNGDINKVFDSLERISSLKKKERFYIELQFLVFNHNIHEISILKDLKKKYRIDRIKLKTAQIYDKEHVSLLPKDSKYLRYDVDNNELKIRSVLPDKCRRIIFGSVITWDGNVVPCCFDKDAGFVLGNVRDMSLDKIRNSDKYKIFIKNVFSQRNKIGICCNCTEGLKNG